FPADTDAIDRYVALLREAFATTRGFYAEKASPGIVSAVAGSWMRRGVLNHARRTTLDVLRELTDNPELIAVLTGQWGDYGLPPAQSSFFMHALVAGHYLNGAGYPVGGSSRIAATVLPVIEARGGAVITNAEVRSIRIERGRAVGVEMADGSTFDAPVVVSNAGVVNTFTQLLPDDVGPAHTLRKQASTVAPSIGHLSL
ncbi:MAG: FAD-dependent oxidoreductase, partial [Myxococcota bacterium]